MAPIQSREMRRHTQQVYTVAFSPCGNFGYSGGDDNRLVMWDMRTGAVVSERTDVHTKWVYRIAAAASGAFIVTCDPYDNRVMVWHAKTLAPMQTLEGHERGVAGIAVSPDSTMIVSSDAGGAGGEGEGKMVQFKTPEERAKARKADNRKKKYRKPVSVLPWALLDQLQAEKDKFVAEKAMRKMGEMKEMSRKEEAAEKKRAEREGRG